MVLKRIVVLRLILPYQRPILWFRYDNAIRSYSFPTYHTYAADDFKSINSNICKLCFKDRTIIENIATKGEITHFVTMFQKSSAAEASESVHIFERRLKMLAATEMYSFF